MRLIFLIFLSAINCFVYSQTITYINAVQKTDGTGLVEIRYAINGSADSYSIALEISFDAGTTYTNIPSEYLNGNLTGVGSNVEELIIWDATSSHPDNYTEDAVIKVIAKSISNPQIELLAHYPFDGNANDISGNNYNGTVYGATLTTDKNNNPDSAYSFDGINDNIQIPPDAINTLSQGTVVAYIYLNNLGLQHTILDKSQTFQINYFQFIVDVNNKLRALINAPYNNAITLRSNTALFANQWYHVAVTWDGQNCKFYLNGLADGVIPFTLGVPQSTQNTFIGKVDNNTAYMKGKIDDVRIYPQALTQEEIQSIMQ